MGYYIGQFYFDKKELFLVLALVILGTILYFQYPLPLFQPKHLLVLAILLLISKSIISSAKDTPLFITFFAALLLTLFWPFFSVVIFIFVSLLTLKLLRIV